MRLEFRTNNAYDTILLVGEKEGVDVVCGEWCLDSPSNRDGLRQFLETTDAGEWDTMPEIHGEPANWGELVATVGSDGVEVHDAEKMLERMRFHLGDEEGTRRADSLIRGGV